MSTAQDILTVGEILLKIGGFVAPIVLRYIDGDNSSEVRRAIDVLSPEIRADLAHARQERAAQKAIRADLGLDVESDVRKLTGTLERLGLGDQSALWARSFHGLELPPLPEIETDPAIPINPFIKPSEPE